MLRSQELQMRMSELRQKLNAADEVTDENRAELHATAKELNEKEAEYRIAVTKEAAEERQALAEDSPEKREWSDLESKIELRNYMLAAVGETQLSDEEKEYNEELGLSVVGGTVPYAALLPKENRTEKRVDVQTQAPLAADLPQNQQSILGRVFAQSDAAYLGLEMPSVGPGIPTYPVLTSGLSAQQVAEGNSHDAVAATYTVKKAEPKRITGRFVFSVEDAAVFPGLEESLRNDLSMEMTRALNDQTQQNLFATAANGGMADVTDPTNVIDYEAFRALFTGQVDGLHASSTQEMRAVVAKQAYAKAETIYVDTDKQGMNAWQWARENTGGVRVSTFLPARASMITQGALHLVGQGMRGAVIPIWDGLRLIRSEEVLAASGQIVVTAIMLAGFVLKTTDGLKRIKIKDA